DRYRHAARRAPPDGPARTRRFHRTRYLPLGHAGAARRSRGLEVPAVSAAGEIRRGWLAWPQDATRVLRLSRRPPPAAALPHDPEKRGMTIRRKVIPL